MSWRTSICHWSLSCIYIIYICHGVQTLCNHGVICHGDTSWTRQITRSTSIERFILLKWYYLISFGTNFIRILIRIFLVTEDFFSDRDFNRIRWEAWRLRNENVFGDSQNDLNRDTSSKWGPFDMIKIKKFEKKFRFLVTREQRSED